MRTFLEAAEIIVGGVIVATLVWLPAANAQKVSAPEVPAAVQAPPGEHVILLAHASGSQIYTCQAGEEGKFSWTLKAPDAETERRQRSHGQSCRSRRLAGCRVRCMVTAERRKPFRTRPAHKGDNNSAHPHPRRQTASQRMRRVPSQRRNEKQLHRRLLFLRSGHVTRVSISNPLRASKRCQSGQADLTNCALLDSAIIVVRSFP